MDWLVIPGQYSGDMWHVAGAMLVDDRLGAVVAIGSSSDAKGAEEICGFLRAIGLGERVECVNIKPDATVLVGDEEERRDVRDTPGKPLAWQYVGGVQRKKTNPKHRFHVVYRSTSFIMRAVEEHGLAQVLRVLGAGLTAGLSVDHRRSVARYAEELLKGFEDRKVLFVLGRIAGYNPQHDLDADRLRVIAAEATKAGFDLVIVGYPPTVTELARSVGLKDYRCIDLRDWSKLTGRDETDERARAYFWRCVVTLANLYEIDVRLVGGRSGSTDIAAFMGVKVLSWDIFDAYNPEYLRLLITAPALLKVTHTDIKTPHGSLFLTVSPAPQLGEDLRAFLAGTFAPASIVFSMSKRVAKRGNIDEPTEERALIEKWLAVFALVFVVHTEGPWIEVDTRPKKFLEMFIELTQYSSELKRYPNIVPYLTYVDGARACLRARGALSVPADVDPLTVLL